MSRPELPGGPYLVVGLARSGRAAAMALRARGERVVGFDAGSPAGMEELSAAGVELHLGGDGVLLAEHAATLVKSPGVPADAPAVARARQLGRIVLGELELAWRLLPNEFVAVTGTNGKTTTVEMIGHVHRVAGAPVIVAGNVGVALSGLVGRLDPRATIVCEASSFQLEDAIDFAPEVAVLLNIAPDHLDRHATMDAYTQAKLRIFANQGSRDTAVLPVGLDVGEIPGAARRLRFGDSAEAELSLVDGWLRWREEPLLAAGDLRVPGRHNLENAMAAAAACFARGVDPEAVREGLRTFAGVAHRMEQVACRDGVRFVNDSKATNVASTLTALAALAEGSAANARHGQSADEGESDEDVTGVHLILGGQGKGQDFAPLRAAVAASCRAVYLIGEDAGAIGSALDGVDLAMWRCETLERAFEQARAAARAGEVVLLSPACASFDQFVDFEARGERFRELVEGS